MRARTTPQEEMQAVGRWVVIGILVLLSPLRFPCVSPEEAVHSEGSASINNTEAAEMECVSKHLSFIDIVLNISDNASTVPPCTGSTVDINVTLADKGSLRPKCDEASGCNVPLNCFNFRELDNDSSVIPDPPQALLVTPHRLEDIVETTSVQNCCAVVLFYAPWCTFSVQFARKFNALGRSFDSLPILAVDLAENDQYVHTVPYFVVGTISFCGTTGTSIFLHICHWWVSITKEKPSSSLIWSLRLKN